MPHVPDTVSELLRGLERSDLSPFRLIDANAIENRRELVAVFRTIDLLRVGTKNIDTGLLEAERNVLWELTAYADDDTLCTLELVDIHDTFPAELLEVEPVSLVEVRRDSLGVIVDHDGALAHVTQLASTGDSAPVELDTAANTVHTRTENHGAVLIEGNVVLRSVVSRVQVVGVGRVLGGEGVDTLDERGDAQRLALSTDLDLSAIHERSNVRIRETLALSLLEQFSRNILQGANSLEIFDSVNDILDLVQEPLGRISCQPPLHAMLSP